jgi:hypothetical protein
MSENMLFLSLNIFNKAAMNYIHSQNFSHTSVVKILCLHASKPSSVNTTLFDPHKLEREGGDINIIYKYKG